jgi:hypothetical protein
MRIFRAEWALLAGKANHQNLVSRDEAVTPAFILQPRYPEFAFLIRCRSACCPRRELRNVFARAMPFAQAVNFVEDPLCDRKRTSGDPDHASARDPYKHRKPSTSAAADSHKTQRQSAGMLERSSGRARQEASCSATEMPARSAATCVLEGEIAGSMISAPR